MMAVNPLRKDVVASKWMGTRPIPTDSFCNGFPAIRMESCGKAGLEGEPRYVLDYGVRVCFRMDLDAYQDDSRVLPIQSSLLSGGNTRRSPEGMMIDPFLIARDALQFRIPSTFNGATAPGGAFSRGILRVDSFFLEIHH